MKLREIGVVIAERQFIRTTQNGIEDRACVLIGMPQPFPDSSDYYVPYKIEGIGPSKVRYAGGIDAIQALQEVMKLIGADLFALNDDCGSCLKWVGDESGGLGFPSPVD